MSLIALLSNNSVEYNPSHHRLRCNGHIINLAAQAFLFPTGDDDTAFYKNSLDVPTERELEDWRQKRPLGKLHNITAYIQRSPQRRIAFQKLSQGRKLIRDNKTRWNSWYQMIGCALEPLVCTAIKLYCNLKRVTIY